MEFSDKFTKSLAATLVQYKNAPIKLKDELVKMFKNIGFSNIEIFGDFKKSEWSKESYNTVIKAWK